MRGLLFTQADKAHYIADALWDIATATMASLPTLVCCAQPFGYGPAAKLLALAPPLRTRWRLIFAGHGSAWELVSRCPALFDRIVEAEASDSVSHSLVSQSAAVLSVMDREFGALAGVLSKPLYVADSLLWMREQSPRELQHATVYWAQNFSQMCLLSDRFSPRPVIVGPMVTTTTPKRTNRGGLLINLGGCSATSRSAEAYIAYGQFVLEAVLRSGMLTRFDRQATVVGGAGCLAALRCTFAGRNLEFDSPSPPEVVARIGSAAAVLTAPGLTNTLECFRLRTPTFFLPPQNYSQWCILRHLRERQLTSESLHWEDVFPDLRLGDRLPESVRNPVVDQAFDRMATDGLIQAELSDRLRRTTHLDLDLQTQRQSRFFRRLGPNGSLTIARQLRPQGPRKADNAASLDAKISRPKWVRSNRFPELSQKETTS